MKTAASRIIVSPEHIEKTIEKIDGLVEKDYEELINRFVKEQPALLEFAGFIKHENSKKFFDAFFDLMIIIWMAFEEAAGKVPCVTEEIFEMVNGNPEDEIEALSKSLNIKDEIKLQKKLEEFNELSTNIKSDADMQKSRSQMGKDFDIIAEFMAKYLGKITQEELYTFIMEESLSSKISTQKKPKQEDILSEELLFVMNCLDEAVNYKPKLKISK